VTGTEKKEINKTYWWGTPMKEVYLQDQSVERRIILTALKSVVRAWSRLIWLRIASSVGHSWTVIDLLFP
jgi:hypothetical protein